MKCKSDICNNEHDGTFGNGSFCSRSCSARRVHTPEANEKRRIAITGKKYPHRALLSGKAKEVFQAKRKATADRKLMEADFTTIGYDGKRRRVILEQDGKCNRCGLDEWLNEPLVIELDHINGNNKDDRRTNLVGLCPNCHSLTPTWRGRNKNRTHQI